jgi:hypothetical protein
LSDIGDSVSLTDLAIWITVFALSACINYWRGRPGFLVYAYLSLFFVNHWVGAMVRASPWNQFDDNINTVIGFRESTYALICFAIGALLTPAYSSGRQPSPQVEGAKDGLLSIPNAHRVAHYYFILGIAAWYLSQTEIGQVPSISAVIQAGKQGVVFAICFKCWLAWREGNRRKFLAWLMLSLAFPVATMLSAGFLGYGIVILITILVFASTFYQPRWRLVVLNIAAVYLGLSLFVAYAASRDTIRGAVWGNQGLETRVDALLEMLGRIEFFSPWDEEHSYYIDLRLNQNELVGAAIQYTPGDVPFRYGTTISDAMIALIPRVIWPDKPVTAGSGDYVSQHTGVIFDEDTSVGMGQVFEFYINFGPFGVIVGFLLLGGALRHMDDRLLDALARTDWNSAALWFMVGTAALQVGGALGEITASMAAAAVLTLASRYVLRANNGRGQNTLGAPADRPGRLSTTR